MALWRVLDITSGFAYARRQAPTTRLDTTKKDLTQSGSVKSGFVRRLSTKPRFFYVATFVLVIFEKFLQNFALDPQLLPFLVAI